MFTAIKEKLQDIFLDFFDLCREHKRKAISILVLLVLGILALIIVPLILRKTDKEIAEDIYKRKGFLKHIYRIFLPEDKNKYIIKFHDKTVYVTKKQYEIIMKRLHRKRIKPEVFKFKKTFHGLTESRWPNSFITLNEDGEFARLIIDAKGNINMKVIKKGFPGVKGTGIYTDMANEIFWTIKGSKVYAYDSRLGRSGICELPLRKGDQFQGMYLVDRKDRLILISVKTKPRIIIKKPKGLNIDKYKKDPNAFKEDANAFKEDATKKQEDVTKIRENPMDAKKHIPKYTNLGSYFVLYDLFRNKTHYTSPYYHGKVYMLKDNTLLVCREIKGRGPLRRYHWYMADIYMKKKWTTALTYALSAKSVFIRDDAKSLVAAQNRLLGAYKRFNKKAGAYDYHYVLVSWNDSFSRVKVTDLKKYLPDGREVDPFFYLSPNGIYGKTTESKLLIGTIIKFKPELVFYQFGKSNPPNISLPVFGGYTNKKHKGYWLKHKEWGLCYIEIDNTYTDRLVVYKLGNVL